MVEIYAIIRFILSIMILTSLSILIIVTMYRTTEVIIRIPPRLQRTGDPDVNSFLWIPVIIGLVSILGMIIYYSQFSIFSPYYRSIVWMIGMGIYIVGMIGLFLIGQSLQREQSSQSSQSSKLSTSQIGIGIIASLLPMNPIVFGKFQSDFVVAFLN